MIGWIVKAKNDGFKDNNLIGQTMQLVKPLSTQVYKTHEMVKFESSHKDDAKVIWVS